MKKTTIILFIITTGLCVGGCVERIIKITTEPSGALVWLNDEEIGATPVTVDFTWYGDYEVVIRKEGYQTYKTSRRTPIPFYQWPVIDFFAEALWPGKIVDRHEWQYQLAKETPTDNQKLIERANELRDEATKKDGSQEEGNKK